MLQATSMLFEFLTAGKIGPLTTADLDKIQERFSGSAALPLQWIIPVAGLILAVFSAVGLYRWWQSGQIGSSPLVIYYRLARELDLDLAQQLTLWRIARRENLPSPITLMMSPATLAHHARHHAQQLAPGRARVVLERTAAIGRKLFNVTPVQ